MTDVVLHRTTAAWAQSRKARGYAVPQRPNRWSGPWVVIWPPRRRRPCFEGTRHECHEYIVARRLMDGLTEDGLKPEDKT